MRGGRVTAVGHHGHPAPLWPPDAAPAHHGVVTARHVALVLASFALLIGAFARPIDAPTWTVPTTVRDSAPGEQLVHARAAAKLRVLEQARSAAQLVWDDSADRVLDESPRVQLHAAITRATQVAERVRTSVVWPGTTVEATVAADAVALDHASVALASAVSGVDDAVAAWEAEQARLAAEAEAARQAAAAAAAAARQAGAPRAAPAGVAGVHIESIWTSGGQPEIDACRGSVNVAAVASYLGAGFYAAEHWPCGGSAWRGIGTGSLVEFAGYGTYRVAGLVGGLSYGVDASALPAGYAGYYQTCIGGSSSNMTVWLLTRV